MSTIARSAIVVAVDDGYGGEDYIRVLPVEHVQVWETSISVSCMSRSKHSGLLYASTRRQVSEWEATTDLNVRMVNYPNGKFVVLMRQEVGEGFAYFDGGYYQEYETTVFVVHPDGKREKVIYSPDEGCYQVTTTVTDPSGTEEKVVDFSWEIPREHYV